MKLRKSVALKHEKNSVPRVVAKGRGRTAQRIIEIAKENNIPVYSDVELVEVLYHLQVGQEIPPQLFEAVAEVLVMIYNLK